MTARDRPGEGPKPVVQLDRTVHEPGRLMILALLSVVKRADFLYLAEQTAMTHGNLSSHMSKLESAGYVEVEKTFVEKMPRTLYSITPKGGAAFRKYRRQMLDILDESTGSGGD